MIVLKVLETYNEKTDVIAKNNKNGTATIENSRQKGSFLPAGR